MKQPITPSGLNTQTNPATELSIRRLFSQQWTYETMKNTSGECEGTHFLCPNGMCLPVFLICNGVNDCSSRLDEYNCDNYACPGYYRYSPVNI